MAKSIADLKPAAGVVVADVKAEEKPKKSKEELKAERVKHLKPKVKDPAKLAEDNAIKEHVKALLTKTPTGMLVKDLRANIFDETDESKFAALEKRIRFLARDMGCVRANVENSRQKIYKLP
jgi:hypothetical protein